jgi:hypothetical protein
MSGRYLPLTAGFWGAFFTFVQGAIHDLGLSQSM